MKEMIMFQAKNQLTEEPCVIGEGIKEDLKNRMDILGMISCCEVLQDVEAKSKTKKKAKTKTKAQTQAQAKPKVKIQTNSLYSDEEENYAEPEEERARKGSANLFISFESIRPKIIKDLKNILSKHVVFRLGVNYYARSELVALGLQKVKKHVEKEKLKTWVVHLFYLIDSYGILNEFLRKHKDSKSI